jgi:hypothetical protein
MSLKDKIRAKIESAPTVPFVLPERDIEEADGVRLRGLSGGLRGRLVSTAVKDSSGNPVNPTRQLCQAIVYCAIGPDGKQVFGDDDIPLLEKSLAGTLDTVWERIQEISGLGKDAVDKAEDVLKNGLSCASGTASE